MKLNKNKGISLIVITITIIVIIILSTAVVLNVSKNNPISDAKKTVFISDVEVFKTELELYKTKQYTDNLGRYDSSLLQADETSITYKGIVDNTKTIKDIINSLNNNERYLRRS